MQDNKFKLYSDFKASKAQELSINSLTEGLKNNLKNQVLLGVTGCGKTFIMANVIKNLNKKALIITHNKTLAAQLCNEFKNFFPNNRVEYFVSYYDYYQPETYVPKSDLYIEKETSINDEIERLRNSSTASLCERDDVIVVATVSCIYGLGAPFDYFESALSLRKNQEIEREEIISHLVKMQYKRHDEKSEKFKRGEFRLRGSNIEIFPSNSKISGVRIIFSDNEIERIVEFDINSSKALNKLEHFILFPCTHYIVQNQKILNSIVNIQDDLEKKIEYFKNNLKFVEAERIKQRVNYDIEMLKETGYCNGIENYLRYFDGRKIGEPPYTLQDFFKGDYITFIDESHMTIPQLNAMYLGDFSRKKNLVDYGFRLDAAFDNRPLKFDEFYSKLDKLITVSATPSDYELKISENVVEQIIRPTGLLDPLIEVRSAETQVEDSYKEIIECIKKEGRAIITTLTKKMAENLNAYLLNKNIKSEYIHSDVSALKRIDIISDLRLGNLDVIVGVNLLREGIDIPELKLVCVFDSDNQGFLRTKTSLIQIIGRAARNADSKVILYANKITTSMKQAINETNRRREIQEKYNKENNIIPSSIKKKLPTLNSLTISEKIDECMEEDIKYNKQKEIEKLTKLMLKSAQDFDFEAAIKYRDKINKLKNKKR